MSESRVLLAAGRRIIAEAARDHERGLHESACVSAHRGAILVSEAWLRTLGQPFVANSVEENICLSPAADGELRRAAARLDRHRVEEASPHRSFPGPTEPAAESTQAVADAHRVLAFVERELVP